MTDEKKPLAKAPLNFLLGCSENALDNFHLARLNEVANLRKELHDVLDRLIDENALVALVTWFRSIDRQSLKSALENEESPEEWAARMIREGQRSEKELEAGRMPSPGFLLALPPEEAKARRRASKKRYRERNVAEGKCEVCGKPQCRESARHCKKHLQMKTERQRERNEAIYSHGKAPGTLKALKEANEKRAKKDGEGA